LAVFHAEAYMASSPARTENHKTKKIKKKNKKNYDLYLTAGIKHVLSIA
jgi:hypothetical protein